MLVERLRHDHHPGTSASAHEARTRWVVVLTAAMMVGELVVVAHVPRTPSEYAERIRHAEGRTHVTIEVHRSGT